MVEVLEGYRQQRADARALLESERKLAAMYPGEHATLADT